MSSAGIDLTLEVRGLSKWYPRRARLAGHDPQPLKAVDGVSFAIARGEVLGLVGESGSGKSTTGALLLGLERPTAGEIRFEGLGRIDPVDRCIRPAFTRAAQLVFQNPYEAFNPRHSIATSILEPIEIHFPEDRATQQRLLIQAMERAGLIPYRNFAGRLPHELSGGQLQRAAIARAISVGPRLLVADEPVAMLDVSIRASVLNLFRRFADELGMSILYITHDLSTMRHLCSRVAVMYRGKIIEMGSTSEVLDSPAHPYSRALAASVPLLAPRGTRTRPRRVSAQQAAARPENGCAFRPRCPLATGHCETTAPQLRAGSGSRAVACHLFEGAAGTERLP
jgi:oligopeptide/dipeptide ABC transporter ATP-binding protein